MAYTRLISEKITMGWAAGTYATPASEAIYEVHNVSFDPEKTDVIAGVGKVGRYYSGMARPGGRRSILDFSTWLRGQAALGTAPYEGALLRACGCYESASGTSAGVYAYKYELGINPHIPSTAPTTSTEACLDPVDVRVVYDNLNYLCENMVGNAVIRFAAGQLPEIDFKMQGQVATQASATAGGYTEAAGTGSFTAGSNPVPVQSEGMTLLVGASTYTPASVSLLELDLGVEIDPRQDINGDMGYGQPIIAKYQPRLTLVIEADLLASYDPQSEWVKGTQHTVTWTHNSGGTSGTVISGYFSGVINADPKMENLGGKMMLRITLDQYNDGTLPYLQWS